MGADTALNYDPALDEEEDDGLGYYDDGVKRTLTDEQIGMFRHSEIEQLVREGKLLREERSNSPTSDKSSVEDELVNVEMSKSLERPQLARTDREPSQSSATSISTKSMKNRPAEDIPYDQRHKRKWENYIEENDPTEGSLTHRRIARELDNQQAESVELEY